MTTTASHTIINLDDVEDMAPKFNLGDVQEARFAGTALGLQQLGLLDLRMKPDQSAPFAHHHEQQEELYVVVSGSGTIRLDDEQFEIREGDAIRIAPPVVRSLASGPGGLRIFCFGAPAVSDGSNDAKMEQS
jgi:uncharacterized cupin superfamily protein